MWCIVRLCLIILQVLYRYTPFRHKFLLGDGHLYWGFLPSFIPLREDGRNDKPGKQLNYIWLSLDYDPCFAWNLVLRLAAFSSPIQMKRLMREPLSWRACTSIPVKVSIHDTKV
ncbi:hypothetical protein ABKN59_005984 [Abortiporus biennis]